MAEPQPAELAAEVDDVGLGAGARVRAGLDRVLLGGQPERVEAQRVQHIAARHPVVPGVDVGRDVAQRVPDVQSLARRIREHVLDEHLVGGYRGPVRRRQRADRVGHVEGARRRPPLLPGPLDLPCELRGVAVRGMSAAGCAVGVSVTPTGYKPPESPLGGPRVGLGSVADASGVDSRSVPGLVTGRRPWIHSSPDPGVTGPDRRERTGRTSRDERKRPRLADSGRRYRCVRCRCRRSAGRGGHDGVGRSRCPCSRPRRHRPRSPRP